MTSFRLRLGFVLVFCLAIGWAASAQEDDQIPAASLGTARVRYASVGPKGHKNGMDHARFGVFGVDSIPNFNGQFFVTGYDPFGNLNSRWFYNTVGNPPQMGGTTTLSAPIIPVKMDLRNFDGSPRFVAGHPLVSSAMPFVQPVLNSPVFSNATWETSDTPTQITDAVQRAEYWRTAKSNWHTILGPSVKTERTMVLIRGTYRFALNADGSCCLAILVNIDNFVSALFPGLPVTADTPIGAAELAGEMTTKDMTTLLFPSVYLYFDNNPSECCVVGFHSFDFEPGAGTNKDQFQAFVMNYSSWVQPGFFFSTDFLDVTAVSHEIAETYNDPFVAFDLIHDVTPWWLAPNGNCQDDLETGDVIEGLPNSVYPITMNGMTYHPQNEALLQWFEFLSPSDAYKGAYSFPNRNTLTALSPPQKAGCAP